ncbi:EsaB/YukD family protein [Streptomyces sp. NPDC002499]
MSESSVAALPGTSGLCRLTVRAPEKSLDLAVPADIPLADLLPVIVGHAGDDLHEAGLEQGGWALQRINGPPLDPEGILQSLELHDGDVVLLRPATETLPPVRFDNLVDGVPATIRGLPNSWSPTASRWALRSVLTAVLVGALALLTLSDGDRDGRAAVCAEATLLLLAGAGAAARVLDDLPGATLLGLATGPFAALADALDTGRWAVCAATRATGSSEHTPSTTLVVDGSTPGGGLAADQSLPVATAQAACVRLEAAGGKDSGSSGVGTSVSVALIDAGALPTSVRTPVGPACPPMDAVAVPPDGGSVVRALGTGGGQVGDAPTWSPRPGWSAWCRPRRRTAPGCTSH